MARKKISDLEELLERMTLAADGGGKVSLDDILDVVGRRSFGPLLLIPGIITVAPLVGDIPGVPVMMGLFVVLVSGQVLLRRDSFWLPQWLLRRSVRREKLKKALPKLRKPARFVDRFIKPRLTFLVHARGGYFIAVACILIAAATPVMEFIPFSANGAGLALILFGLAMIAQDGLFALLAHLFTLGTFGVGFFYLLA